MYELLSMALDADQTQLHDLAGCLAAASRKVRDGGT